MPCWRRCLLPLAIAVACAAPALAETTAQSMLETMDMLAHAIATPTVQGKDQVPALANYLAGKLQAGGFAKSDVEVIPVGHTAALVARYRGNGKGGKPILLSAHMDVVAASNRAAWAPHDPFKLTRDGAYLYGRGVADMKTQLVVLVETMLRLKREGFVPDRDLILVFSGDEETEMASTAALAKRYHDAAFALNGDAGGGIFDADLKPVLFEVEAAEKTYADFELTVTSPGGHSSEPTPDNAIYRLGDALHRIASYPFPVRYNAITLGAMRAFGARGHAALAQAMQRFAAHPGDAKAAAVISADPAYVGQLRTTCVATMLQAGDAPNALPKHATANVNCRIFPGVSVAAVEATLNRVIADPHVKVSVRPPPPVAAPASEMRPDVTDAVAAAIHARFPGLELVPEMDAGASDCIYFRNAGVPCYGVDPAFAKPNDSFMHGINERLLATEIPASLSFWHDLLVRLATPGATMRLSATRTGRVSISM